MIFEKPADVRKYAAARAGIDGRHPIGVLAAHLAPGASVLELGMGHGRDLELLAENYEVTGSDASQACLDVYAERHPDADLLRLDARTLGTERRFDAIYSNKVLHLLTRRELHRSIAGQKRIVRSGGILQHSLWSGTGRRSHTSGFPRPPSADEVRDLFREHFGIAEQGRYGELLPDDSLYFVCRLP